jgi:outer membrane protein W
MKKLALLSILACSVLLAESNQCKKYPPTRDWIAELRAGAFIPTWHTLQKRFGHGWIEGEAEFTYRFKRHFGVWGNAGYSFKKGHSPYHHTAHLQLIPVSAGLKIIFCSHKIRPYLGIGPCYTFTHYKNYSPFTRRKVYKNRWGFAAKSGIYFDLPRHWVLDVFVDYYDQHVSFLRAKKADVSGFRTGIGLGYRF